MATINVTAPDGTSKPFNVDDSFLQLPDDQKQAQIAELEKAMPASFGPSTGQPLPPSGQNGPQDTSYGSALQYGASNAVSGLGATAADLGGVAARNGMPEMGGAVERAGNWMKGAGAKLGPDPSYAPAGPSVVQAIKEGRLRDAVGNLLRAGAEGLPDVGATLGAAALGGPAASAAYIAGRSLGPTADARAANNGETSASTADVAAAVPSTVVQSALGTLGLGKFGPSAALVGAAPKVLQPLVRTGEEAVAGAANDAAQQLGGSVGTTKGAQLDTDEVAASAAQAGAARGISEAGKLAAAGAGRAVNAAQTAATPKIEDPVQAASIERVNRELDAARTASTPRNGEAPPDNVVLNTVKSTLAAQLSALTKQIKPLLDSTQAVYLNSVIDQALRHNNDIGQGDGAGYRSLFDNVADLPVDAETKAALSNGIVDLNTVSTQSFEKNLQGPAQKFGAMLGRVAPVVHGIVTGNPIEAGVGLVTGAGSHGIGATLGGKAGAVVDNILGTAVPNVTLQRVRAQQALKQAGVGDVGPLSTQRIGQLVSSGGDPTSDLYRQLNIPKPDVVPLTPQQQRAQDIADAQAMDRQRTQAANSQRSFDVSDAAALDRQRNQARATEVTDAAALDRQQSLAANSQRSIEMSDAQALDRQRTQAANAQRSLQVGDAVAMDRQRTQTANFQRTQEVGDARALDQERNQSAAGQAQQDAANARQAAQAQAIKAAQTAQAIKQAAAQKLQAATGAGSAEAQVAAQKQAQEDAMWNQAATLQGQAGRRVAATTQSEVRGHMSDMARVSNARQALARLAQKQQTDGTNLNEAAANRVSGMAYNGMAAREARNNGIVGAKATNVGPSPAYAATGGAVGAPGGEAPMIQQAPVQRVQARTAATKAAGAPTGAPATAPAGKPATAPQAAPTASGGPSAPARPTAPATAFGQAPPPGTGFTSGWKSYVHQGLKDHGINATADDIHQAIAHTVQNGSLAKVIGTKDGVAAVGDALAHHGGDLRGDKGHQIINLVAAQVAQNKGMIGQLDANRGGRQSFEGVSTGQPGVGAQGDAAVPNGGPRGPILNLHRWKGAAANAQGSASAMAGAEEARGNVALARTVRSMAAVPAAGQKTSLANAHLASLKPGTPAHDHATKVLAEPILRKGV